MNFMNFKVFLNDFQILSLYDIVIQTLLVREILTFDQKNASF